MISMANAGRPETRKGSGGATDNDAAAGQPRHGTSGLLATAPLPASLGGDLMEGAEEIAEFLFDDRSKKSVRKVFFLASEVDPEHRLPIFKLGKGKLAARRSRLLRWIHECEEAASSLQAT